VIKLEEKKKRNKQTKPYLKKTIPSFFHVFLGFEAKADRKPRKQLDKSENLIGFWFSIPKF
jgi:hypothetical protein